MGVLQGDPTGIEWGRDREEMCHCVGLFPKHSLETPGGLQDPLDSPKHLWDISRPVRGIQNPPHPHEDSLNAPRLLWDISRLFWMSSLASPKSLQDISRSFCMTPGVDVGLL